MTEVAKHSLGYFAYVLALVGGILMIVFSLLGFLGYAIMSMGFGMPHFFGGFDIVVLILGVVAIFLSKRASELIWAIVLIIIGILGGGIGGLLVLVGGILGLISKYV